MAPLFLPLLVALALARGPVALADALEGDSSGKQPHSASLSLSPASPLWKRVALEDPGRDRIEGTVGNDVVWDAWK